jgi:hypothetical protein
MLAMDLIVFAVAVHGRGRRYWPSADDTSVGVRLGRSLSPPSIEPRGSFMARSGRGGRQPPRQLLGAKRTGHPRQRGMAFPDASSIAHRTVEHLISTFIQSINPR